MIVLTILKKFKLWKRWEIDQDNFLAQSIVDRTNDAIKNKKPRDPNKKIETTSLVLDRSKLKRSVSEQNYVKMNRPVVGYSGFDRMIYAGNVNAVDYRKAKDKANNLIDRNKRRRLRRSNAEGKTVSETSTHVARKSQPYSKHPIRLFESFFQFFRVY